MVYSIDYAHPLAGSVRPHHSEGTMKTAYRSALLVLAVMFFLSLHGASLAAEKKPAGGGYTGPGPAVATAAQAKTLRDDTPVTMQGYIVQSLGGDKYVFRDDSGTIRVEIDHDKWGGLQIGPEDKVELRGEVDKDWNSVEIEVHQILKR